MVEVVEPDCLLTGVGQGEDLGFTEEAAVEGEAGRRSITPEAIRHHHRWMAGEIREEEIRAAPPPRPFC